MARGEFIRSDGLVLPNNITVFGARSILAGAVANIAPTFFFGLVTASPDPELLIADCIEPTIGVNGYARIGVARTSVGWPTEGNLNGQPWFETDWLEWTATDGPFDQAVQRLMLVQHQTNVDGDETDANLKVMALSSAMPDALTVDPDTGQDDKRFKYRIYGV